MGFTKLAIVLQRNQSQRSSFPQRVRAGEDWDAAHSPSIWEGLGRTRCGFGLQGPNAWEVQPIILTAAWHLL